MGRFASNVNSTSCLDSTLTRVSAWMTDQDDRSPVAPVKPHRQPWRSFLGSLTRRSLDQHQGDSVGSAIHRHGSGCCGSVAYDGAMTSRPVVGQLQWLAAVGRDLSRLASARHSWICAGSSGQLERRRCRLSSDPNYQRMRGLIWPTELRPPFAPRRCLTPAGTHCQDWNGIDRRPNSRTKTVTSSIELT